MQQKKRERKYTAVFEFFYLEHKYNNICVPPPLLENCWPLYAAAEKETANTTQREINEIISYFR